MRHASSTRSRSFSRSLRVAGRSTASASCDSAAEPCMERVESRARQPISHFWKVASPGSSGRCLGWFSIEEPWQEYTTYTTRKCRGIPRVLQRKNAQRLQKIVVQFDEQSRYTSSGRGFEENRGTISQRSGVHFGRFWFRSTFQHCGIPQKQIIRYVVYLTSVNSRYTTKSKKASVYTSILK